MNKANILLVEDDKNLGFVVKDNLEMNGYTVTLCENGQEGWNMYNERVFDICILDIMLPILDGFSLAQKIREDNTVIPLMLLSAKTMKEDKIQGFKLGVDDYITKPFSIEELIFRIEVFLKRSKGVPTQKNQSEFSHNNTFFDYKNLRLKSGQKEKILTQKEADIFKLLLDCEDQVVRREDILKQIWGDDDYFLGRSLDVFISKLRGYVKDDPTIEIANVHGVGFRLTVKRIADT